MNEVLQAVTTLGLGIHFTLILIGARRKRFRICLAFYIYLLVSFVSTIVISYVISEKELRRQIYYLKEFLLDLIKLVMLFELNRKIFGLFPRVRRSNRALFGITGMVFVTYAFALPVESKVWWGSIPFDLHSKVLQTTCLAYLILVFSALYYRIEVPLAYKYLVMGYLISQLPVALGFAYVAMAGEAARDRVSLVNSLFFVLAMLVWTRVYLDHGQNRNPIDTTGGGLGNPLSARTEERNESAL
ncbi:MAG: hypothetical protein U0V70_18790 [Terriglobia bacterium]